MALWRMISGSESISGSRPLFRLDENGLLCGQEDGGMTDVTCDDVFAVARMLSISLTEEDLVDITFRVKMILGALETFSDPRLDEVAPAPYLPFDEVNGG